MAKPKPRLETVIVSPDAEGLVSRAGAVLLVELADRAGLTAELSAALAPTRERRSAHDPGRVLRDVAVMLADGGDCVTDLDALRALQRLFGQVASETTTHRVLKAIDGPALVAVRAARAGARAKTWAAGARPDTITLDIDATLLTAHSDKDRAARLRVPPDRLLAGGDRRSARGDPAARERPAQGVARARATGP